MAAFLAMGLTGNDIKFTIGNSISSGFYPKMEHVIFLFYLISLSTGILSIGISTGIYLHYRREPILFYIFFHISLALIIISLSITRYLALHETLYFTKLFSPVDVLAFAGLIMVMVVLPRFLHSLIARPYSKLRKILFPALAFVQAVIILLSGFYGFEDGLIIYLSFPFIFVFVYCLVLISVSIGRIGNRILRNGIIFFFVLSLLYFPLNILETIREKYPFFDFSYEFELFTLPLYFFALNLFSIIFALLFFNQPAFLEKGRVTTHFRKSYQISKRESEIIECIVSGMKNEDIADKLFISIKTVNNHIYNIFQKTAVKNRVQLANLLNTNRQQ
jgi:DNA-binding CsgD family transcriptional regulator